MEKLVLLIYAAIAFWVLVAMTVLYFVGLHLFAPTVDATCAMWQHDFRQCAADSACLGEVKRERPETCYPPQE